MEKESRSFAMNNHKLLSPARARIGAAIAVDWIGAALKWPPFHAVGIQPSAKVTSAT
jgi:hypothetical protein